ncbi:MULTISPECIES: hypothetical protein [unclassified Moorena]|uniref:hypothetical protein n=1 Tax=unclassified Moorena TaxID=2683338 RepID=UPI0013BCDA90|nr:MULTISPECIES: hypothetical protein [unclassified Moorena]NEP33838.1 hypothetical protein [Moorena sp. SIO3B2]NEQ07048.1 hypothetical protein [Moorena sp. SIO4E2]
MLTYRKVLAFQIEIKSEIHRCVDEIERIDKKGTETDKQILDRATLVRELKVLNRIKQNEFFDVEELKVTNNPRRPGVAYLMWEKERERRLASCHSRGTSLRAKTDVSWYMSYDG